MARYYIHATNDFLQHDTKVATLISLDGGMRERFQDCHIRSFLAGRCSF